MSDRNGKTISRDWDLQKELIIWTWTSLQQNIILPLEHPTDTSTKLDHSVLKIATTAAVGLYLYKKRRSAVKVKAKHSVPVPDQMELEVV